VLIGTLLGRLNWLGALVLPSFHAFRQVTLIAWVPLLTLWAGQDEPAKLIFIALAVFVPMTLCACEGARAVSFAHLEVTEVFGVSRWTRFRWVILPSALPHLCAGLELGIVYAWLATIGAEYFFRAAPGIGNLMVDGREHFQMDLVLCGVCVVGGVGFLVNRLTLLLRARLLRWAVQ
jgi:sulfonate transport system permease protein